MKKRQKKGNILLLFLVVFMAMTILAAVFLNVAASYAVVNRIMFATGEGAKMRAQAVDIRLKEQEGIVEAFHHEYDSSLAELDKFHDDLEQADGHEILYHPTDTEYQEKAEYADEAAKNAAIAVLKSSLQNNVDGTPLVDPQPENFCMDVQPIPAKGSEMKFHCTAWLNGQEYEFSYTYILSAEEKFQYKELEVKNAVFFASVVGYQNFIHNGLTALGLKINPNFKYWEVAFPQVDSCAREADPTKCNSAFKGYDLT